MNPGPRSGLPVSIPKAGVRLVPFTLLLLAAAGAGGQALTVSPGEIDRASGIAGACPTFLWSIVEGAAGYELAVFDLAEPEVPRLVLSRRIEGSAPGWTPGSADCLEPGKEYAWTVRALIGASERASADLASAEPQWSPARRFQISGAPSDEEVTAALEVLRRWQAAQGLAADGGTLSDVGGASLAAAPGGSPAVALRPAARASDANAARNPQGANAAAAPEDRSVAATGTSAIRGELPDTTGATFGVTGISHSTTGAGLVAINDTTGADLILDGEANGATDTILTQSGLDRASASGETFNFQNSGAGAMTVEVDGSSVWHAGNDGTGNGLDADLLDGQDSSAFAGSAHDHLGETWTGANNPLTINGSFATPGSAAALLLSNSAGHGLQVGSAAGSGVAVTSAGTHGYYLGSTTSNGLFVNSADLDGVRIDSAGSNGVEVSSAGADGVHVTMAAGDGVDALSTSPTGYGGRFQNSAGGVALYADAVDGAAPDLVLAGSPGVLSTSVAGADLFLTSHDDVEVYLNKDNNPAKTGYLDVLNGTGVTVLEVDEDGNVRADGDLTIAGGVLVSGDLMQPQASDGTVKAGVVALCSASTADILRSFSTVETGGGITISDGAATGECTIDFGFQVSDRYIVATAAGASAARGVSTKSYSGDTATFLRWDAGGSGVDGTIHVLVY